MASPQPVTPDTLIAVKVSIEGSNRRFKIPLKDLTATTLPLKLRQILSLLPEQEVVFERFSDSAGAYVTLDPNNLQVYKSLFRAAKAKLKLRLKATVTSVQTDKATEPRAQTSKPIIVSSEMPVRARSFETPMLPHMAQNTESSKRTSPPATAGESSAGAQRSAMREDFLSKLNSMSRQREIGLRMKEPLASIPYTSWSVYCNNCDKPMSNEHYHCSVCDSGDYDLCEACVAAGVHCPGEGHWLIKRFVNNGNVINSMTRTIPPKIKQEAEPAKEMPGAFTDEKQSNAEEQKKSSSKDEPKGSETPTRTCNGCIAVFPEQNFVSCKDCPDYDLCMACHLDNQHGHHPAHRFEPVSESTTPLAKALCCENRGVRHAAICDGCDQVICGVRHKCLNCPDWDYCSGCIKSAKFIHPAHRFVPIYERLPEPRNVNVRHVGIYCDGPLCQGKRRAYVEGVRYKCAVCHDTDFCATCEASPSNRHNRTHPLIKFKTPVRNVSVTTMNEDRHGSPLATLGDRPARRSTSTETNPTDSSKINSSPVQTIFDVKPAVAPTRTTNKEKIEIKDLLAEPIEEKIKVEDLLTPSKEEEKMPASLESPKTEPVEVSAAELNAHFVRDTICDGTKVFPSQRFIQAWTLRNPGPHTWPVGCSVRYVGGDNMLNVDHSHPSSAVEIAEATESNVLGAEVKPNEDFSFRILMKAPQRGGTAISYWRLKAPDGTPFGHRLWCHVDVVNPIASPSSSGSRPWVGINATASPPDFSALQQTSREAPKPNDAALDWATLKPYQEEQLRRFNASTPSERYEAYKKYITDQRRIQANCLWQKSPNTVEPAKFTQPEEAETPANTAETPAGAAEPAVQTTIDAEQSQSNMIFPTLEKESPVTSVHEAESSPETTAPPEPVQPAPPAEQETIASPLPSTVAESEASELFEDAESVEFLDSGSDDEGFVTDEEWDVLGASDEETVF